MTDTTDRPILFSAPMVRALLAGRKTQTRRALKPQPAGGVRASALVASGLEDGHGREIRPRWWPGDRLWVRESFSYWHYDDAHAGAFPVWHWVGGNPPDGDWTQPKPSIHMPRWASRLTLAVTAVRVQRLQDITDEDARAEGSTMADFAGLWSLIHGPGAWEANPWVVALTFDVFTLNIDDAAWSDPT